MEHSLAARFSIRPAARFPKASAAAPRPRLGLRSGPTFRAASVRPTILHRAEPAPVTRLRHDPRSIAATRPTRPSRGRPVPVVSPTWARSVFVRRASAPVAPWRG
ncbi:MAG TPA: hypothetical protein VFW20_06330 [Candidatus Limnocylindrales bacterium]|nr:hypothetical protein [Candidatus Limnocylindrales bacterium]